MQRYIILLTAIVLTWTTQAQDVRKLSSFDGIAVIGNIEVIVQQGEEEQAVVEVFGIDEDDISVYVSHNTLRLQLINSLFKREQRAKVTVTYKQLRSLKANAGSRISSEGAITADKLYVRSQSGSEVTLEVKTNVIDAGAQEGAVLRLSGATETFDASAATGGKLYALELESKTTYANANTGGEAEVVALDRLDASANTGGSIRYKGAPGERNTKTVLSGDIKRVE
jgi:hypothetical protein